MCTRQKYGQSRQTDWGLLEASDIDLLVATAFPDPAIADPFDPFVNTLINKDIDQYHKAIATRDGWCCVRNASDLQRPERKLLLHIEGLNTVADTSDSWEQLERWYVDGVRSFGLHWNLTNALGGGTTDPDTTLTDLGGEVVRWLEERKTVLDLAHSNQATFFAVADITKRPLLVSHGNVAAVCSSNRNYSDEQLARIARSDGVIGVFFAATFTVGEGFATVDRLIDHIDHVVAQVGIRHVALGSDFGGIISGTLQGIASVADYSDLPEHLARRGYTSTDIDAITYQNAERVLRSHL